MTLSVSYHLGRLTLSKVNIVMCLLLSASWLLGRHVCSVIQACQKRQVGGVCVNGEDMMLSVQLCSVIIE